MNEEDTKQAILGFTEFFKGITGNQDLKIPDDIAKEYEIEPWEMAKEEAIVILRDQHRWTKEPEEINKVRAENKALDMAIEALEQEPCEDCISRKAVMDYIKDCTIDLGYINGTNIVLDYISKFPSVQPIIPKTGHWIEVAKCSDGNHKIECSECGSYIFVRAHANSIIVKNKYKYCPNCGAYMRGEDKR